MDTANCGNIDNSASSRKPGSIPSGETHKDSAGTQQQAPVNRRPLSQTWAKKLSSQVGKQGYSGNCNYGSTTGDTDDDGFTQVGNRRSRKRRRSTDSQLDKVKVVGKANSLSEKLAAAKKLKPKRVYCVGNVSTDFSGEDLKNYLADFEVEVISCFTAKTRFEGTAAFRVCIAEADRQKFLNAEIWPSDVIIRDWVFKGNKS